MVASHTAVPLGTAKWLERAAPPFYTLPLGKGQEQHMSPTIKAGLYYWGQSHTSHLLSLAGANSDRWFAVPKGTAVWLATLVRCLWHPHCKRPNGIFFANCLCLLPLASSLQTAQRHPFLANCPYLQPLASFTS